MLEACHPDHLERYHFVEQYAHRRRVLDVGCATGYGTARLAGVARFVLGIDINESAIQYAIQHYAAPRCQFRQGDFGAMFDIEERFDLVVSFEVIEHVPVPVKFLKQIASVLESGGLAVLSTPNRLVSAPGGGVSDPTHLREFTPEEFVALIEENAELEVEGLYGVHLGATVWKRHAMRSRLGRMDVLGLRKLIPGRIKARFVRRLVAMDSQTREDRERLHPQSMNKEGTREGVWIDQILEGAYSQIAVCRKET